MRDLLFSAVAALAFLIAPSAQAAEEIFSRLKIGDHTFTNVIVANKTATDLFILHQGGVASFKLKNLSPTLQKQFGFDAAKAAAQEKTRADAIAEYNEARIASSSISQTNGNKQIWAKIFLNQTAPDLIVEKWLSAVPETEGKFVLLCFWMTSSEPCQKTIPLLNQLHQKFGQRLIVMGLSDEPEEIVRGLTEPPVQFFSAIDSAARTRKAVGVRGLPHVLLIDPAGIVRWEGFPLLDAHALTEQVVQAALNKFTP